MQTKNTTTATAPDMATGVKNAIEAAPSRTLLITAKAKLDDLNTKANAELEGMQRLREHTGKNSPSERVSSALEGKPIADQATDALIDSATIRWQTYKSAAEVQTIAVRKLEAVLYNEVNASVKRLRQPVVDRVANALAELRKAAAEDAAISAEMSRNGVNGPSGTGATGVTQSPVMRSVHVEKGWLDTMRQEGYNV
jgi:hypothetical protein